MAGFHFCAAAWFEQLLTQGHWLPTVLRMVRVAAVMVLAASADFC
jgi:hypothetical protein